MNWRNTAALTWDGRQLSQCNFDSSNVHGLAFKYNADGIRAQKYYYEYPAKDEYSVDYIVDGTKIIAETYTHAVTGETRTLYYYYDENGITRRTYRAVYCGFVIL